MAVRAHTLMFDSDGDKCHSRQCVCLAREMPFSATSPYDPSSTLGSQYGVKCWDLHIYMHVHTFVHTYRYTSR